MTPSFRSVCRQARRRQTGKPLTLGLEGLALLSLLALSALAAGCDASSKGASGLPYQSTLAGLAADGPLSTATPTPKPTPPATSGSSFLLGANVPWYNWACDFGCGATGGGVSDPSVRNELGPVFARARASGIQTIRWWMFEGDPWQIDTDGSGTPAGINPAVYNDVEAALQLGQQNGLRFDFVLFSSPTAVPTAWLTDSKARDRLAAVLGTMFKRFGSDPQILSWEVFNEPELDIWNGKVEKEPVQATVKAVAAAVHANSSAEVTVGSAMLDGLSMWVGQGLDYYQAHWYDYMSKGFYCARCTDYGTVKRLYGLDAPLVIGELYVGPDTDALQRYQDFYDKGFAGAWGWSLLPRHTADQMAIDLAATAAFAARLH